MGMGRWIRTTDRFPQPGASVDWISPGGEQVDGGTFEGGVVWFPPGSAMYIYYTPEFWRPAVSEFVRSTIEEE